MFALLVNGGVFSMGNADNKPIILLLLLLLLFTIIVIIFSGKNVVSALKGNSTK